METFSALLAFCEGNPPATSGFPSQRPLTQSFDLYLNKSQGNTQYAGDLWSHHAHYDVTVMKLHVWIIMYYVHEWIFIENSLEYRIILIISGMHII